MLAPLLSKLTEVEHILLTDEVGDADFREAYDAASKPSNTVVDIRIIAAFFVR